MIFPCQNIRERVVTKKSSDRRLMPTCWLQFSSVTQSSSTLWDAMNAARQASLSITNSWSLPKLMSIKSVMPSSISSSVIPFSSCPQSLPASVFSNESTLHMRWPKYWSFSCRISPSKEHPGRSPLEWTGWISLQSKGLPESSPTPCSKTSILRHSAFFTVQISHPYMTTGKTIALTRRTFVGKVMSLLCNMLSRLLFISCFLICYLHLIYCN